MANRFIGHVASAAELVALLDRFPSDRIGGGPGSLPAAMASSWGPALTGGDASQFASVYQRVASGRTYFLGLIDGPPSDRSSFEAWRSDAVELDIGPLPTTPQEAETRARVTAHKSKSSRDRSTFALVLIGVVIAIVVAR